MMMMYSPRLIVMTYNLNTRFDNTVTLVNNVILKLSTPLASNIEVGDILNIDARIMKSWVEKIVAFPSIQNQSRPDFSDPNFGMDMSDQVGAEGTNWKPEFIIRCKCNHISTID